MHRSVQRTIWLLTAMLFGSLMMMLNTPKGATAWETAAPESAGFDPRFESRLEHEIETGALNGLHGVVVARHGKVVLERYLSGPDQRWGDDLGEIAFGPEVLHDLRSISKSVVGLLYGIALTQGRVPTLDARLVDHFPYDDLKTDPARRGIEVRHALTMTIGLGWDESLPYIDARNSEVAMEMAEDRYHYILSRPVVAAPGSTWTYSGGSTALLAHLIARGSGQSLHDFAREQLFAPLGIAQSEWVAGTNGEAAAASGLRLTPRDLAKIGQLVLNKGRWDGREVVPQDWLEASFTEHAPSEDGLFYGYQWWLGRGGPQQQPWMAGFGNGGQRLVIIPHLDLVMAVTAGAYNQRDAWRISVRVLTEVVFPALVR